MDATELILYPLATSFLVSFFLEALYVHINLNFVYITSKVLHHFRLPPQCRWDLRSSGILQSAEWRVCTDVLGLPVSLIFKCQEVQEERISSFWRCDQQVDQKHRYRTATQHCMVSQKCAHLVCVVAELPPNTVWCPRRAHISSTLWQKPDIAQNFGSYIVLTCCINFTPPPPPPPPPKISALGCLCFSIKG
jgi:hypothetical protein